MYGHCDLFVTVLRRVLVSSVGEAMPAARSKARPRPKPKPKSKARPQFVARKASNADVPSVIVAARRSPGSGVTTATRVAATARVVNVVSGAQGNGNGSFNGGGGGMPMNRYGADRDFDDDGNDEDDASIADENDEPPVFKIRDYIKMRKGKPMPNKVYKRRGRPRKKRPEDEEGDQAAAEGQAPAQAQAQATATMQQNSPIQSPSRQGFGFGSRNSDGSDSDDSNANGDADADAESGGAQIKFIDGKIVVIEKTVEVGERERAMDGMRTTLQSEESTTTYVLILIPAKQDHCVPNKPTATQQDHKT